MQAWSIGQILFAIVLVAVPVLMIVGWVRRLWLEAETARRLRQQALEREAMRRPAPETTVVEGRVVVPAGELHVVTRNQFGCLGGPVVHVVPAFDLELDDGTRKRVELGQDPVIENLDLLAKVSDWKPPLFPEKTGAPHSVVPLRGRVRVAGVLAPASGLYAPPEGRSAVLTILTTQAG